jgi:CheY-like chemotaxis protein
MDERDRPLRVLVVDDSPDMCETTLMLLQLWGYDVSVAADGPAALDCVAAYRPDVVLLDLALPRMNGYEVARRLRGMAMPQPFLVSLSGYGTAESNQRAREAGCDLCWIKPADPDVLQRLLASREKAVRIARVPC